MRTKRYRNSLVGLVVTMLLVFVSCQKGDEGPVPVTISLNQEVISLVAGSEQTLTATVTPTGSSVEWFSNKTHIATVSNGIVKAIDEGVAKIVAKSGNSTAICEVIVTKTAIPVTGITLSRIELEMREGELERLMATLEPFEATDRRISWSSSNDAIVSIEQDGTLTAHTLGEAVITATALDGNHSANCVVSVLEQIELLAPSNNASFNLHPTDAEKAIAFSWRDIEGINTYILQISTTELFQEENIIYTAESPENNMSILEYDLNDAIKEIAGNSVSLYWTIISGTEGIRVLPESRSVNFIPDRREYLSLLTSSATDMDVEKMEAPYHYSITANGNATINTVGLKKEVSLDSGTVSFLYRSNKVLPELTIHFKKPDGTVSGTIKRPIPQAGDWREMRLEQAELPEGWGKINDYLQLDLGSVSSYQLQVNAIQLKKGVYTPEILSIKTDSWNNDIEVIEHRENYFKFKVINRDPLAVTEDLTQNLPASAVLFSFEYKSTKALGAHFQLFLYPLGNPIWVRQDWYGQVPINTGDWKEHTVDMTNIRSQDASWGKVGDALRLDFGEEPSDQMIMEIRNIQVKMKE